MNHLDKSKAALESCVCPCCGARKSRVAEIEAENGKLRELVDIMHRYAVKECIGCTHRASGTCDGCAIIGYERRMNELGIGVE